jgi:hypothetical protein
LPDLPALPDVGSAQWLQFADLAARDARDHAPDVTEFAQTFGECHGWSTGPDSRTDAFRHCVWSCSMTQRFGGAVAQLIGSGHELDPRPYADLDREMQPLRSHSMDFDNNAIGRGFGESGVDCASACENAVNNDVLTHYEDGGGYTDPDVAH